MEPYTGVLFVHVIAATGLFASVGALKVNEMALHDVEAIDRLCELVVTAERLGRLAMLSGLTLLATGLYMVHSRWSFASAWVVAALLTFVYNVASARLVTEPRYRALLDAAFQAGTMSADLRRRIHAPVLRWVSAMRLGGLVLLVFLMTTKPALATTLAAAATAALLGVLIATRPPREPRAALDLAKARGARAVAPLPRSR